MKWISTNNALKPSGHYSQAVVHNGLIYVSNQLAVDPNTGVIVTGTIEEETDRILRNIEMIVSEAGRDKSRILRTTAYITDISYWEQANAVYRCFFEMHKPVRTVVVVKELHFGCRVGIEAIAALTPSPAV